MLALTKIKKDIDFNKNFKVVLEVLKAIAASQFYMLEKKLKVMSRFDEILSDFFGVIEVIKLKHPFWETSNRPKIAVAVTSDQGLLGGLNMRVVKTAVSLLNSGQDLLVVVGEQGKKSFSEVGDVSLAFFPGIQDDQRHLQARALARFLFKEVIDRQFGSIQVVYPKAFSLVNQRVDVATLLPVSKGEGAPAKGGAGLPGPYEKEMILESSPAGLSEYLAYLSFGQKLNHIFGMSRLAETGARYVHLEESGQKVEEVNKKLKLRYFRLRHEIIDQSMRELFSARLAYGI